MVDDSFRDRCCEREVLDLKCSCRYSERNCDWSGELRHLRVSVKHIPPTQIKPTIKPNINRR